MKTLLHLQNEAIERFEKEFCRETGLQDFPNFGETMVKEGIRASLVTDFLKTELETIVKESFKNTRVDLETIFMFEKAGQCSSLMYAHPKTEFHKGWNNAVWSMLRNYLKQPTLEEYKKANEALSDKQEMENQFLNN